MLLSPRRSQLAATTTTTTTCVSPEEPDQDDGESSSGSLDTMLRRDSGGIAALQRAPSYSRVRTGSSSTYSNGAPLHTVGSSLSRDVSGDVLPTTYVQTTGTITTAGHGNDRLPLANGGTGGHTLQNASSGTAFPPSPTFKKRTSTGISSANQASHSRASIRLDLIKTIAWISLAMCAAGVIWAFRGRRYALEFITGYIVEYSLSVDNLFVFLLIFNYFKVPREPQETVLFWGILGAMILRGVMIVLGKALMSRFAWVSIVFAIILLYSAVKLLLEDEDEDENLDNNRVVKFSKRLLPVSDRYSGGQFFVYENGKLLATPLMVVLISIELSDVVFAMDSVPAVLGISNDPLVIYSSNVMAVMGLRSLFFVIADAISNLRFLRQALASVLGFIGIKTIMGVLGHEFDVLISLGVVVLMLGAGVVLSFMFPAPPASPSSSSANDHELQSTQGSEDAC